MSTTAVKKSSPDAIARAHVRLVRVPVDPPEGDAIQKFSALELPIVTVQDEAGQSGIRRSETARI
jgi:hypothetical protein